MTDLPKDAAPPPGWYPDPSGSAGRRYWDGKAWGPFAPPRAPGAPLRGAVLPRHQYTPWIVRLGAFLIDVVPIAILFVIGEVVGRAAADCSFARDEDPGRCGWAVSNDGGGLLALGFALALGCYALALAFGMWNWGHRQGKTGSSVGKSVLGFKVVSERTWHPIGFGPSLLRQFLHFFLDSACFIGFLWPLWDGQRQTFADKIGAAVCVPTSWTGPTQTSFPTTGFEDA